MTRVLFLHTLNLVEHFLKRFSLLKKKNIALLAGLLLLLTIPLLVVNTKTQQNTQTQAAQTPQTVKLTIAANSDIANQAGTKVRIAGQASGDSDIITTENWIGNYTGANGFLGLRFSGASIPANSQITGATLEITSSRNDSELLNLTISAEKSANPLTFSTTNSPSSRLLTTNAKLFKQEVNLPKDNKQTFDVLAPVQELLQTTPNNGIITMIIKGNAKAYDWIRFYNNLTPAKAPVLSITYIPAASDATNTPSPSVPTATLTPTQSPNIPTATPTPTTVVPTIPPTTTIWKPALNTSWQWQLAGAFNPATDLIPGVQMYDIDLFNNSASTVQSIHNAGAKAVCYMETGSWEDYRPDANQYPAAILGKTLNGYPDEKYVDIRNINDTSNANVVALRTILQNRLQQCKDKGFDGIEPDIDDAYFEGDNATGFPVTYQDQVNFNKFVAAEAHKRGLSIGLKNGADPQFVADMLPVVDWVLNEQCFQYSECAPYSSFVNAGKAVFQVEYSLATSKFCSQANSMNFNSMKKNTSLDKTRTACR